LARRGFIAVRTSEDQSHEGIQTSRRRLKPPAATALTSSFPYDTQAEFGTRAKIPVIAWFDGVSYTGSLVMYGHPQHMLPVLEDIREKIGKAPGDTVDVDVVIRRDESVRSVEVPPEFVRLLRKEGLLAEFEKLSYTHRKEYWRWIMEPKREETRKGRMIKALELLKKVERLRSEPAQA
jgi:Domain of unknown function (DUF1905)/Bacteriocin-protection, YdeI or OmpD-Associated